MDIIDNFKKVGKNWRLLVIVIWLLIGVSIIPFPDPIVSFVGIIIFLPFLVFLMFLFLLSLISKKDIFEYPTWKIILFLLISLPIMLLISVVLIVLFAISIVTYFFFSSWFILYGCYLLGRNIDNRLYKVSKAKTSLRIMIFIGGLIGSILLLIFFIIGPTIFDYNIIIDEGTMRVPWYLNGVYVLTGGILLGLAVISIIFIFKKVFAGWLGIFALLVSFYTLFLVLKIYFGIINLESISVEINSIWAYLGMIIPDLFIIFYSLSTLMGSQAELLSKRFKRFKLDTVIIWLILSKVAFEFIRFFPYTVFEDIDYLFINQLAELDNNLINLVKNVAVLAFFLMLLVIIGVYEIYKYYKEQKRPREEVDEDKEDSLSPQPITDEYDAITPLENVDTVEEEDVGEKTDDLNQDQGF